MHVHHGGIGGADTIELHSFAVQLEVAIADNNRSIHGIDAIFGILDIAMLKVAYQGGIFQANAFPDGGGRVLQIVEVNTVRLGANSLDGAFGIDAEISHGLNDHPGGDGKSLSSRDGNVANELMGIIGGNPGAGLIAGYSDSAKLKAQAYYANDQSYVSHDKPPEGV